MRALRLTETKSFKRNVNHKIALYERTQWGAVSTFSRGYFSFRRKYTSLAFVLMLSNPTHLTHACIQTFLLPLAVAVFIVLVVIFFVWNKNEYMSLFFYLTLYLVKFQIRSGSISCIGWKWKGKCCQVLISKMVNENNAIERNIFAIPNVWNARIKLQLAEVFMVFNRRKNRWICFSSGCHSSTQCKVARDWLKWEKKNAIF